MNGKNETGISGLLALIKGRKSVILIAALLLLGVILIFVSPEERKADNTDIEDQLEELCSSLSGVGSCRVMVTYNVVGKSYASEGRKVVESVTVVCKGADRVGVRAELTAMLSSLFGIGTNRIHISKMK